MEDPLAYLLALRLRARGRPEALEVIDRALAVAGRARTADAEELRRLEAEVQAIAEALALRYGAPAAATRQ